LPCLFLFTFIETKIVYNTIVSFFFLCGINFIHVYRNNQQQQQQHQHCTMSMLFKLIKTMILIVFCHAHYIHVYRIQPTSGVLIHPAVRSVS
jgi:NADH:ubiquinone oxidoreductase subunit H